MSSLIKRFALLAAITFLVLGTATLGMSTTTGDKNNAEDELVVAAREAYEAAQANYPVEKATVEDVYIWSRRLMEARVAVAEDQSEKTEAIREHLNETQEFHKRIKVLYETGGRGGSVDRFRATKYYYLEAKRMLAQAENAKP